MHAQQAFNLTTHSSGSKLASMNIVNTGPHVLHIWHKMTQLEFMYEVEGGPLRQVHGSLT